MAIIQSYPTGTPKNGDYLIGTSMPEETGDEAVTKNFPISAVSSLINKGYKDYVFSFTQSGTNDPVVTELNNDTGLTFTFTRDSAGTFFLVPSSNLDLTKTWMQVTGSNIGGVTVLNIKAFLTGQIDVINLQTTTGNPIDDVDFGFVELRIYN